MTDKLRLTREAEQKAQDQYRTAVKTYEAVGRGISTWAATEMRLVQIVAKLLGADEHKTGLILYSINNFHTWISIIDGLFEDNAFTDANALWSKLKSQLKAQNDIRVRLAHQSLYLDIYENDKTGEIKMAVSGLRASNLDTRSKQRKMKVLSLPEITAFSVEVSGLHEKLIKVLRALGPAA
jgi:hypothetical protein